MRLRDLFSSYQASRDTSHDASPVQSQLQSVASRAQVAQVTMDAREARNRQTLNDFAEAWAARDVDRLMRCVTDDFEYGASVGPEPGAMYVGAPAARAGFDMMLRYDNAMGMELSEVVLTGDCGVVEWRYEIGEPAGAMRTVRGVDVIRFRDGLIASKDAFRKSFS